MMQEFLDAIAGNTQAPPDPMEALIPKHLMGLRNYSPIFMGIIGVSAFTLTVTLSEVHPIFEQAKVLLYLGLVLMAGIDYVKDHKSHGYVTKSRVIMYGVFYGIIGLIMSFILHLVHSI